MRIMQSIVLRMERHDTGVPIMAVKGDCEEFVQKDYLCNLKETLPSYRITGREKGFLVFSPLIIDSRIRRRT